MHSGNWPAAEHVRPKMATNEASFVASSVNIEVEGDITVPGAPDADDGPSTLDEPVIETLVSFFEQSISCPDEVDFFNIQLCFRNEI